MGYIRHHALVITAWQKAIAEEIHSTAIEIFGEELSQLISPLVSSLEHDYHSFFIAPDGGREWRETSEKTEVARGKFMQYLRDYDDPNMYWMLITYADENGITRISDCDKNGSH